MLKRAAAAIALTVAVVLAAVVLGECRGFGRTPPQRVLVRLFSGTHPSPGISVRYYDNSNCGGAYVAATTDSSGRAIILRPMPAGYFNVLRDEQPSLCVESAGKWVSLWSNPHPAYDVSRLECNISVAPNYRLERAVNDKVPCTWSPSAAAQPNR